MEPVKQTGFLYKEKPTDFITGASPLEWKEIVSSGDWTAWKPSDEKQASIFFDTMSCTTFSRLNTIETWINYFIANSMLSADQLKQLNDLGFIENGKFNASDRFTAIMSGTTPQGNYFQNVCDSVRTHGLLPEKDLPFGGSNWAEYHNKNVITQAMKDKALKILDIFEFPYEFTSVDADNLNKALKQTPLQVAIPEQASHAVQLIKMDYIYDTYPPFLYPRNVVIPYALKAGVLIKKLATTYKYFTMEEKTDSTGKHSFSELDPTMRSLCDKMRGECGFPWKITSGYRTKSENDSIVNSVSDSSHVTGLAVDVYCVDSAKRDKIVDVAKANGIKRIGIGQNFVHLDIDKSKPQGVLWHYY